MNYLIATIAGLIAFWLLWVFFLAVMALKRARDDGLLVKGGDAYTLGMSVLFVGWVLDFIVNMLVATVIFIEPPLELTVTARVTRLKQGGGWRGDIARWMCAKILDPFEQQGHCK